MELSEYKKQVKAIGYSPRVKSYSDFKAVEYMRDGVKISTGVMTRADMEENKALHELRAVVKGNVFDGYFRVVV